MMSLLLTLAMLGPLSQETAPPDRSLAAGQLRTALEQAESRSAADAFQLLLGAGREALGHLRGSRAAEVLDASLAQAADRSVDLPAAATRLRRELTSLASTLAFEPLLEAPLPRGFPAPTPLGEIELKAYPRYRLVEAEMKGGQSSFWQLFSHIQRNDIAMTAPVETTYSADGSLREERMAFLYESPDMGRLGSDGTVEVLEKSGASVVSIGCRGYASRTAIQNATQRLESWLSVRLDLEVTGPLRVMGYNSPMVPGDRRFFEVQIPVRTVPASDAVRLGRADRIR